MALEDVRFNLLDQLEQLKLTSEIEKENKTRLANFELEKEKNKIQYGLEEQSVKIEKIRQEIRNMTNSQVLFSELIKELPQIAASMPQIKELKILQTSQSDPLMDSLTNFITKVISLSESLGIKFPIPVKKED